MPRRPKPAKNAVLNPGNIYSREIVRHMAYGRLIKVVSANMAAGL
jgi:hypothetical protein